MPLGADNYDRNPGDGDYWEFPASSEISPWTGLGLPEVVRRNDTLYQSLKLHYSDNPVKLAELEQKYQKLLKTRKRLGL